MKKWFLLFAVLVATSSLGLAAETDTYAIDSAHSSANFAVKHMGISTVHGRFTDVSGTILFDEKAPEKGSVKATIKSASVSTDNATRDKHLNTPEFFDTATYPEIKFRSTSIRKLGGDKYVAVGSLTIRDVTKTVEIPFTLAKGKGMKGESRLGIEGTLKINRYDYHVNYDPTGLGVSKDISIELSTEAVKEAAKAAAK